LQVDGSIQVLTVVPPVNTTRTNITVQRTGTNTLVFSWPSSHLGWDLQTNSVNVANPSFWFTLPGSSTVTNVTITIDRTKTNVFYRLHYLIQ
jgi:hypothetical protein